MRTAIGAIFFVIAVTIISMVVAEAGTATPSTPGAPEPPAVVTPGIHPTPHGATPARPEHAPTAATPAPKRLHISPTLPSARPPTRPSASLVSGHERIPFTFENVSLAAVIKMVAEITGKNFLLQMPMTGTVLSYCPKDIPASAAFDMLDIILDSQGYTMVESENPPLIYVAKKVSAPKTLPAATGLRRAHRRVSDEGLVPFTFEGMQLASVIKMVAERTGRNFLVQTPITGRVTIYCPNMIPSSTAFDMLRIIVDTQGYTMVERENPPVISVVKKAAAPRKPGAVTATPRKGPPRDSELETAGVSSPIVNIVKKGLFRAAPRQPRVAEPPPPPLEWELVGITRIRGNHVAIIRDRSKRGRGGYAEYMVREGQEVPGYFGLTIVSITPNPPVVKYDRPGVGVEELKMGERGQRLGWSDIIRPAKEGYLYVVKVPELQKRIGSAEAHRGTLRLEPNMDDTGAQSLKITSLSRDNFLYAGGLRQGDVIQTINGEEIRGEASALSLLRSAAKQFNIQLGITRGRGKRTIIWTLLKN